jgi:hypothetical protein
MGHSGMKTDEYLIEAMSTLFAFQMLEEALKIRIGLFHEINGTPNFDEKGLMKAPLGPLISKYEKASGDGALVASMKSTLDWRNFCAHNAYLHSLYSQTGKSQYTPHSIDDLRHVRAFSNNLVLRVGDEIKALRANTSEMRSEVPQPIAAPPLPVG